MSTARNKTHIVAFMVEVEYPDNIIHTSLDQEIMLKGVAQQAFTELMRDRMPRAEVYNENGLRFPNMRRTYFLTPETWEADVQVIKEEKIRISRKGKKD